MRKLYKFALLMLSLVLIVGVFAFSVSADESATASHTPTASTQEGIRGNAHTKTGNLATSGLNAASFSNYQYGYTPYTVTKSDGSNYVELVSGDTVNTDMHFQFTPYSKDLYDYDSTKNQYGVFDFDIATETDMTYLAFISNIRKGQTTSNHTYTGSTVNLYFNSLFTAKSDEFMHVTVIQNLTNKTQYIYINNVLVHQVQMIDDSSHTSWKNGEVKLWPSFKFQMHHSYTIVPPLTKDQTILIDNLQYHYFAYNTSSDALAPMLSSDISSWADNTYNASYVMPEIPDAVEVDGVRYKNLYDAEKALSRTTDHKDVTLLRSTPVPLSVGCNATVYTNGYTFSPGVGYGKTEISSGVYEVNKSTKNLTVKINGTELYTTEVSRGATLGSLFGAETMGKTVIFDGGKLYKGVSWSGVDWNAKIDEDMEISGTGTEVSTYFAHNGTSEVSVASLSSALTSSSVNYVILGGDATLTASALTIQGTRKIYLNDHTLTQEDGSNHCFTTNSTTRAAFYGPGTINNMITTDTYSLIATMQNHGASVAEFYDLTINVAHNLSVIRDGTIRFNNCECNVFSAYGNGVFSIGEKSTSGVNIDVIDTEINFTQVASYQLSVFKDTDYANTTPHTINVVGSTIIAQSTIIDLGVATGATVNIEDSTLVAQYLVKNSSSSTYATINFINNVNVNNSMQYLAKANTTGLTIVKSNNHLAPLCYSRNYATVTWWTDNTVEYWAEGSTPVRNDKFIPTRAVVGGESCVFDSPYSTPPFSLKGNLTLSSDVSFNLYVTEGVVDYVTANGKTVYKTQKMIGGVAYDTFTLKLSPSEATSAFDVFFVLKDGNTVARTISVAAYAKEVLKTTDSVATKNVVVATLEYIRSSALYFGVNADFTEINDIISANPYAKYDIPTSVTNVNDGDVSSYFTGAQLDLTDTLKMRLNVKAGANITSLSIKVNGRDADYVRRTSYVQINLRAYELSDVITITVNGVVKDYSLAEYLIGAKSLSSGSTSSAKQCAEFFKDSKGNLASAIYNYAIAARAYKPVL